MKIISFLKSYRIPILCTLPTIVCLGYMITMAIQEDSLKKEIYEKALLGDPNAVRLLKKYSQPWKLHSYVIKEAIKGNKNALEILDIEIKEK